MLTASDERYGAPATVVWEHDGGMRSRNYAVPRIDNFCFMILNEMPDRCSWDLVVKSMITAVTSNLASTHGILFGAYVPCVIGVLHWAVHHDMDVVTIANNNLFVDLESYLEW